MYEITNLVYLRQIKLHQSTEIYLEFIIIANAILSGPNHLKGTAFKTKMSQKQEKEERV